MAAGKKTGGRKAGTPNKLTFETRQVLVNVLAAEFDNLPALFEQLTPEARIDVICKLSKYVLPTLASVSSGVIMRQEKPEKDMFAISEV